MPKARSKPRGSRSTLAALPGARPAPFPKNPQCQLATLVAKPPSGSQWLHEMKFDGYRMLCSRRGNKVHFTSRNGLDWTARMKSLIDPIAALAAKEAVFDGEVVVLDSHGVSHFQSLQNAFKGSGAPLVYYVFDLLYLDGYDLTRSSLEGRKSVLQMLLPKRRAKSTESALANTSPAPATCFFAKCARPAWKG